MKVCLYNRIMNPTLIINKAYLALISKILPHFIIIFILLMLAKFNFLDLKLTFGFSSNIAHEYWRILSAHWIHLSFFHCIMNLSGMIIIAWIFDQELSLKDWLIAPFIFAIFISLTLYLFPPLGIYAGFSGILHGLWTLGALQANKYFKIIALLCLAIKLLIEIFLPESFHYGFIVSHTAHLSGISIAIIYFITKHYFHRTLLHK